MSETKTNKRLLQIFAARLVLEVFGGAGAIWGFSEVCTFRRPDTQENWRFRALLIGFLFFIRFILQIKDYLNEIKGVPNTIDKEKSWMRFFQIFLARIVLEVFGGGGAIWGFSEALTLRYPETQEFWRHNALVVASLFFIRYLMQMSDYITEMGGKPIKCNYDEKSFIRGFQIFLARLVLEVFGGAGAIWGFSEAATLRNAETNVFFRPLALTVGFIFFIRYLLQIKDMVLEAKYGNSSLNMSSEQWTRLFQIFSAKLVLEVFGGAGAIWGFSEALTLRNPDTVFYWRPIALFIGFVFFCRWLCQIKDYLLDVKEASPVESAIDKLEAMESAKKKVSGNKVQSLITEKSPLVV